jgi:hypothetical protein
MRRDITNADRYNRSQALFRASCAQPPLAENGTKGLLRSAPRRAYGGHKPGPAGLPYRGSTHPADRRPGAVDLRPLAPRLARGEPLQSVVVVELGLLAVDPSVVKSHIEGFRTGDGLDA